jgi:hypothetical protein
MGTSLRASVPPVQRLGAHFAAQRTTEPRLSTSQANSSQMSIYRPVPFSG